MKLASRVFKTQNLIRTRVSKARVCCFDNSLRGQICHVEPWKIESIRLEFWPPLKQKSTAHYKILKVQTPKQEPFQTHSQTPPSQTHSLTHSQAVRSPPFVAHYS